MIKLFLSAFLFPGLTFASALTFTPIKEPVINENEKNSIKEYFFDKSLKETRSYQDSYIDRIYSEITYYELLTGLKIKPPHLVPAFTKSGIIENIFSLKRTAHKYHDIVSEAASVQIKKESPIRLMISDISINSDKESCTVNPILDRIHLGEVVYYDFKCNGLDLNKLNKNFKFIIAYSNDYKIRILSSSAFNDTAPSVNPLIDDPVVSEFSIEQNSSKVNISGKITFRPI